MARLALRYWRWQACASALRSRRSKRSSSIPRMTIRCTSWCLRPSRKETGIAVEPISAGSGVIIKRIQTEKDRPGGDIIWGVSRSLLETNKQYFCPVRVEEQRRDPRRVPRAGRPVDRQQPASDGDPAKHQGASRRSRTQDVGRSPRSQMEGQDRLHRSGQLGLGLFHRHHARRSFRRRRRGLGEGQAADRQHQGSQPVVAGVPGRRQWRVSARHLARIRRLRLGRRRGTGENHLSGRRHDRADGRRGGRSRAAQTRTPPRPSSTTSTARMCAR